MEPLKIAGAWIHEPRLHHDHRGVFLEWFRNDALEAASGLPINVAQANWSVSGRNVLRGVHYSVGDPGQAKYVTCVSGAVFDVVVDLCPDSPNFGAWDAVLLEAGRPRAVYISEGLGHAFLSLKEGSTVLYLCSTPYSPEDERGVNPLDPDLGVKWPLDGDPVLSDKDRSAPPLATASEKRTRRPTAGASGRTPRGMGGHIS